MKPTHPESLAGRPEIREILGVSKQRVHSLEKQAGFPRPMDVLDGGRRPVWRRRAIIDWAARRDLPST